MAKVTVERPECPAATITIALTQDEAVAVYRVLNEASASVRQNNADVYAPLRELENVLDDEQLL